jgi:hypothetical protein
MAVIVTVPNTPADVKGSFLEKAIAAWRSGTLTMLEAADGFVGALRRQRAADDEDMLLAQ